MDAEPRARLEEVEEKPRGGPEVQDDGYETSNSGDPPRAAASPPRPEPEPPADPPAAPSAAPPQPVYGAPPPQPPPNAPQQYPAPEQQYRPFDQQPQQQPYQHFPFPKYGGEGFPFKREEPYDMSGGPPSHPLHHPAHLPYKREDDMYNGTIKRECEDPYSFVEEEAMSLMLGGGGGHEHAPQHALMQHMHAHAHAMHNQQHPHMQQVMPQPKKRGRKKKIKDENGMEIKLEGGEVVGAGGGVRVVKERKKHDRFNGMSEEEVSRRTLPDHLAANLDLLIIGINPGLFAAYKGHHYAGPGNHFWKCLYLSGLTREQMSADEDYKLLNFGIGFTNMVSRATKGSADLTRREIKEGCAALLDKLQAFRPKVAVFNGKLIYEVFSGKKDFCFGKQPDTVQGTNTYMWVMPSSSARCAQLPRAADKVPFYAALKRFRDFLNGLLPRLDESELVFPDTTARRPQDEQEIRRLTQEPDPSETLLLEDGTEVPLKKKRGRPKKVKLENGEVAPPAVRAPRQPRPPPSADPSGEQPPKKKRGRPKKIRPEEQAFLMQQQQQQQQQQAAQQAAQAQAQSQPLGSPMLEQFPGMGYPPPPPQHPHLPHSYPLQGTPDQQQQQGYYQHQQGGMESPLEMGGAALGRYGSPGPPAAPYGSPHAVYASPRAPYSPRPAGPPAQQQFPPSPAGPAFPPQSPPRASPYASPAGPSRGCGFPSPSPLYARSQPSPLPPAPAPAAPPYPAYTPSPQHTPYSQHSSPAPAPPPRTPSYEHHFAGGGGGSAGGAGPGAGPVAGAGLCSLSQDLSAAMQSPPAGSPPAAPPDWEPPQRPQPSPAASTDMHPGSNSNSSLGDYNKTNSVGSEMSPAGVGVGVAPSGSASGAFGVYDGERLAQPYGHSPASIDKDHYHYSQEQASDSFSNSVPASPRMESLHQMYPSNYNRSTPEGDSQQGFRPPEQPHTPHHHPGSPAEYGSQPKPKPQDVASKSLSGLESLVDQIPSIAEGAAGGGGVSQGAAGGGGPGAGGAAGGCDAPLDYPALYPPYGAAAYNAAAAAAAYPNNGYGGGLVGYGGGWGVGVGVGAVVRPTPTPAYLPDWQYGYAAAGYAHHAHAHAPPYNAPYYNGYAPPPAHHQQPHYLSTGGLLELHKAGDSGAGPALPSVSFPGFC